MLPHFISRQDYETRAAFPFPVQLLPMLIVEMAKDGDRHCRLVFCIGYKLAEAAFGRDTRVREDGCGVSDGDGGVTRRHWWRRVSGSLDRVLKLFFFFLARGFFLPRFALLPLIFSGGS